MQILNSLLAQAPDSNEMIKAIFERLNYIPAQAFRLWPLILFIAVAVVLLFRRQKKIAQNQVDLAQMMQELLDKK